MKTKNVVLGLAAVLMAAGTAFGSLFTAETAWIKVRYDGEQTFECRLVGQCDDTGTVPCRVKVTVNSILGDYHAFKSDCVTELKNTSAASIFTVPDEDIVQIANDPLSPL